MGDPAKRLDLLNDPDFLKLSRSRNRISLILTVITLVIYYGFIFLLAFNKPFFGKTISEGSSITIGMPIGIGVIVASWILTGIYVRWANTRYDALVRNIRSKVEHGAGSERPGNN